MRRQLVKRSLFDGAAVVDVASDDLGFAPDLLPVQFAERVGARHVVSGETRLLLAVLEDAIVCYLRGPQPGEPPYSNPGSEARRWVETRGDRGLFSYESICGLLNIDAQRLRKLLRQTISKSRTPGRLAVRPKATPFISGPKSRAA